MVIIKAEILGLLACKNLLKIKTHEQIIEGRCRRQRPSINLLALMQAPSIPKWRCVLSLREPISVRLLDSFVRCSSDQSCFAYFVNFQIFHMSFILLLPFLIDYFSIAFNINY